MTSTEQDKLKKEIVELQLLIKELEEKALDLSDNKPDINYVSTRLKKAEEELIKKKKDLLGL